MSAEHKNKEGEAGSGPGAAFSLEPDDDLIIDVDLSDKVGGDEGKSQAESFQIEEQAEPASSTRSKGNLLTGVRAKASNAVSKAKGVFSKPSQATVDDQAKPPTEAPSTADLSQFHKPPMRPQKLWLTDKCVERPTLIVVVGLLLSLILGVVAFAVYPPKVDMYESSDAFTIGNHPSVEAHRTAVAFYNTVSLYNNAAQFSQFVRRSAHPVTPRGAAPLPTQLLLVYKSKNGKSVLTPENLENARRLEAWIAAHPTYQKLCTRVGYQCQPPTSAVPYYFPSAGANGRPVYDGRGMLTSSIPLTTQRVMTAAGNEPAQWYFEPWSNAAKPESRILRSAFLLGQPGQGSAQYKEIVKFIKSVRGKLHSYDTDTMMVVWAQKEVLSSELNEALLHDALLIIVAGCIIFLFLWLLLESLFLAAMGILTITLSMMLAYFMYAVVFQVHYFGAVNLLVVFVCLGIAVDDIFVVVNAFKHTKDMYAGHENAPTDPDELLRYRLGTSFRKSASAVFLTSFTTAASVLTNMLSPLQGVRTFVLFMATIVMMCYVLTVTVFPAVIVIWARQFEGKPSRLSCAWANRWPSLTAAMSTHLENKHIPFFIGTPLRRAISLLVFLALLVASIALCTQLQVTGAELQILGKGKNYQRWVETRNYYGDTSTTACQSCQSIAPALMMQDAALGTVALTPEQLSAMSGAWVPPSPTTTTSAVLTPTVPVNADVPLQPNPVMKPQTQAAAVPAATPVTTAATNPNQVTVTQVAMPTASASDGPGPGSDCDSKSLYAASKVIGLCGDTLFANGRCLMSCAMMVAQIRDDWLACRSVQTKLASGAAQKLDWAVVQCETVHSDVQLIKDQMLRVYLTWGLTGYTYAKDKGSRDEKSLLPVFDDRFDFYDPNTQLDMLSVCNYLRQNREFSQDHPDAVRCFVEELQAWLQAQGQSLPLTGSRAAQSTLLMQFLNEHPPLRTYVLWRVTPSPSGPQRRQTSTAYVGAVNVLIWTPRREGEDARALHDYYTQWNNLIAESNARSGPRFWGRQSAKNWEMVITKMSTVNGIAWSIGLSAMIAALSLLLFSQSPRITVYSMMCLLSNTIMVLGLVRIFGWSIGMLEALSLSILLGLAVDYLLHVSEEYLHLVTGDAMVKDRYSAVRHSVGSIGVSVIYSAVTTCASVLVLVFASFDMIKKMGLIIFFALLISILLALIPFPALLAWIGPIGFRRSWKRAALCLVGAAVLALLIVACLYIAHAAGANILGPSGNPMFG